jgi:hypothetical protein
MNDEQDLREAVSLLKEKLKSHHGENITGSKVGELLINHCNFRLKNLESPKLTLSEFIVLYLPDTLSHNGSQGGDVLYLIGDRGESLKIQPEYRYWLAFAKADEPNQFAIRKLDSQPVISRKGETPPDATMVPKVTLEDLEHIKDSFIASHSSGQPELPGVAAPYLQWVAEMKQLPAQQMNVWSVYRIEQLKRLFQKRLAAIGIDEENQARLVMFLSESQLSKPKKVIAKESGNNPRTPMAQREDQRVVGNADTIFRSAVVEVISRLSIAELREIKLPAGLLADALQGRN